MHTPTIPTTEFIEVGHWPIGPRVVPVLARFSRPDPDRPGSIELWALDLRLLTVTVEEDGVVITQHEDAPGGEAMTIVPQTINEIRLAYDLGRLKRLSEVPDTP